MSKKHRKEPTITAKQLNERELETKKAELDNRIENLDHAKKVVEKLEENLNLSLEETKLSIQECYIVKNNPTDFESTDGWKDHIISKMDLKIRQAQLNEEFLKLKHENGTRKYVDQIARCEEDIPPLQKRIKELEAKI